jgi:Ca2+-dependent lipid-binding protein
MQSGRTCRHGFQRSEIHDSFLKKSQNVLTLSLGFSDPYVKVSFIETSSDGDKIKQANKTKVVKKTLNPEWNETFVLATRSCGDCPDIIRFDLFDQDLLTDDALGTCSIEKRDFYRSRHPRVTTHSLSIGPSGKGTKGKELGTLFITIERIHSNEPEEVTAI